MATIGSGNVKLNINMRFPAVLNLDTENADERFRDVLVQLWDLHKRKGEDYGRDGDPYANIRQYQRLGLEPWVQCVGDIMENLGRVESFIKNGSLKNDPVENSLLDIASYAIIAYILYNELEPETGTESIESLLNEARPFHPNHKDSCTELECRGCRMID